MSNGFAGWDSLYIKRTHLLETKPKKKLNKYKNIRLCLSAFIPAVVFYEHGLSLFYELNTLLTAEIGWWRVN
jgi:hypothetical protein